jgi:hypothetical protein
MEIPYFSFKKNYDVVIFLLLEIPYLFLRMHNTTFGVNDEDSDNDFREL